MSTAAWLPVDESAWQPVDETPRQSKTQQTLSLVSSPLMPSGAKGTARSIPTPPGLQGPPLTGYEAFATPQSDVKYAPDQGAAAMLPLTGSLVGGELGALGGSPSGGAALGGAAGEMGQALATGKPLNLDELVKHAVITLGVGKAMEAIPAMWDSVAKLRGSPNASTYFSGNTPGAVRSLFRNALTKYIGPDFARTVVPEAGDELAAAIKQGKAAYVPPRMPKSIEPPPGPVGTSTAAGSGEPSAPLPPPTGQGSLTSTGPSATFNAPPGFRTPASTAARPVATEEFLTGLVKSRILTLEQDAQGMRMFGGDWDLQPGEGNQSRVSRLLGTVRAGRSARGMADTSFGPTMQPPPATTTSTGSLVSSTPIEPSPVLSREPGPIAPPPAVSSAAAIPSHEELSNAITAKTNDPVFGDKRATQLLAAANGEPGWNAIERRAAPQQIANYMGTERRAATELSPPSAAETQHALVNEMAKYNVVPGRTLSRQEVTKAQTILGMASKLKPYEVTERLHAALGLPPPPG